MAGRIEAALAEQGLTLPTPARPVADYVPFVLTGRLLFVSGQLPFGPQGLVTGQLTAQDHAADGTMAPGSLLPLAVGAATLSGLNLLAQVKAACGDLDAVARVVKLTGFVNATADFTQHPTVINGASGLMVGAFGEAGRHARSAVGVASLPLDALVEVEAIFELH